MKKETRTGQYQPHHLEQILGKISSWKGLKNTGTGCWGSDGNVTTIPGSVDVALEDMVVELDLILEVFSSLSGDIISGLFIH